MRRAVWIQSDRSLIPFALAGASLAVRHDADDTLLY
jgi:hypothetical protein